MGYASLLLRLPLLIEEERIRVKKNSSDLGTARRIDYKTNKKKTRRRADQVEVSSKFFILIFFLRSLIIQLSRLRCSFFPHMIFHPFIDCNAFSAKFLLGNERGGWVPSIGITHDLFKCHCWITYEHRFPAGCVSFKNRSQSIQLAPGSSLSVSLWCICVTWEAWPIEWYLERDLPFLLLPDRPPDCLLNHTPCLSLLTYYLSYLPTYLTTNLSGQPFFFWFGPCN